MNVTTSVIGSVLVVIALLISGCSESKPTVSWEPVPDTPRPDVEAAIHKADAAAVELGSKLMIALQAALEEGGPVEAIKVCQEIAPSLAQDMGAEHGVRIGRTSFRLRNQNNRTPGWARSEVQRQSSEMSAFVSSERVVGRLRPIPMMPLCAQCHGTSDQITKQVGDALLTHYPSDRATGFGQGEIRGYFWVEVDINEP